MSRIRWSYLFTAGGLALAIINTLICPNPVHGQSDTWNVDLSSTWGSPANWLGGNPPNSGGVATFGDSFGLSLGRTITNDVNPVLGGIVLDTHFIYTLTGGSISVGTGSGPFNLNALRFNGVTPTSFGVGHIISSTLTGNTTAFNKIGSGTVTLSGTNTFVATGGINITGGELRLTTGDAALGNISNALNINGGMLRISSAALTTNRAISIGSNGAEFLPFAATTLNGTISGTGTLKSRITGGLTIGGNALFFTGGVQLEQGTLTLNQNGALGGNASMDIAGVLALNNTAVNNNDRIANNRNVTLRGAHINLTGNSFGTTETVGNLNLATGGSSVTVVSDTNGSTMRFSGLTRNLRSTVFFRGTNLGAGGPADSNVEFTSSPGTLVGGGGGLSSTDISILPFAVGSRTATGTAADFVTWDSSTQRIYVLDATNYTTLAAATPTSNVNVTTTSTVAAGGQTINALRAFGTINGAAGDKLTITSGAIIGGGFTINADVNFGTAEGIVHAHNAITLAGQVSGSNGLTKSGGQILTLSNASNDYTGVTTINAGRLRVNSNSALGLDTSAIVLNSNSVLGTSGIADFVSRFSVFGGPVTINRNFVVNLGGASGAIIGAQAATDFLTLNGNIQLNALTDSPVSRFLTIESFAATNSVVINGNITGTGGIANTATAGNVVHLNGNNTYSGGTNILGGTIFIGHDNAFGTGKVFISNASAIAANFSTRSINNFVQLQADLTVDGNHSINFNGDMFLAGRAAGINVLGTVPLAAINGDVFGGSLVKLGAGSLALNNTGNSYTGVTVVQNGTLLLGGNALYGSGVLGTNPNTNFGTAGTVFLSNASTASTDNIALLTTGAFTIDRSIAVGGTNGQGTTTIGGVHTSGTASFNGRINLDRGVTLFTATTNGSVIINGQITETGGARGVEKIGTGVVVFTNANTYSGNTLVSSGTLLINNSVGSGTGSGNVTVGVSGTLGGTGAIAGSVDVFGALSPGASIETLESGALTLHTGSSFIWEAANSSPTGADLMVVNGQLSINNSLLDLSLANLSGPVWSVGDKLTLISYTGTDVTSGFVGYLDDTVYTFGVNQWLLNYNDTVAGLNYVSQATGSRFVTFTLIAVPEPASGLLATLVVCGLAARRRRRSN